MWEAKLNRVNSNQLENMFQVPVPQPSRMAQVVLIRLLAFQSSVFFKTEWIRVCQWPSQLSSSRFG